MKKLDRINDGKTNFLVEIVVQMELLEIPVMLGFSRIPNDAQTDTYL